MASRRLRNLILAPVCEASLILLAGLAAYAVHKPLFFASLGPTAYEITESPERKSAEPYNVIVGHLTGVVCGFLALAVTHAWYTPAVSTHSISILRVVAAVIAALLTVAGTLLLKATQPAALSTTLVIATGSMQQPQDAIWIMLAILLITAVGEPLRRWRLREQCRMKGMD